MYEFPAAVWQSFCELLYTYFTFTFTLPLWMARGPVVGMRSGGRGMRLPAERPMLPALETLGALTLASTTGLDDDTLAETGRLTRDTLSVYKLQNKHTHIKLRLELYYCSHPETVNRSDLIYSNLMLLARGPIYKIS